VLEALAASGLRSIRYAHEIPAVESVVANDISVKAYQSMVRNVAFNKLEEKVFPACKDASMLMYGCRDPLVRFDVIDLDPYGSPSVFLDATVQSVRDGGGCGHLGIIVTFVLLVVYQTPCSCFGVVLLFVVLVV